MGSFRVSTWFTSIFILNCDTSENTASQCKLVADGTSVFCIVKCPNLSAIKLNLNLANLSNSAFKWSMSFNPDPCKQAQEAISLCKT